MAGETSQLLLDPNLALLPEPKWARFDPIDFRPEVDTPHANVEFIVSDDPNSPRFTLHALGNVIDLVKKEREAGKLLHQMTPEAKRALADLGGIYTVVEPRYPQPKFRAFHGGRKTKRSLEKLGDQATTAICAVEGYEDPNTLASKLDAASKKVVGVQLHNVSTKRPRSGAVISARRVDQIVPTQDDAIKLAGPLQAMLRTAMLGQVYTVSTRPVTAASPDGPWVDAKESGTAWAVVVHELDEYANRETGNAVGQIDAKRWFKKLRMNQPPDKRSLSYWNDEETFPPEYKADWETRNKIYQKIKVWASYGKALPGIPKPALGAVNKDPDLIQSEVMPAAQATRDGLRDEIERERGDSKHNQEQNPNKRARTLMALGVDLKRRVRMDLDKRISPAMPEAATVVEAARDRGMEYAEKFKERYEKHRASTVILYGLQVGAVIAAKVIGVGVESLVETAIKYIPAARKNGGWLVGDLVAWRRSKEDAIKAGERIDRVITHLTVEHARLREFMRS
jgi:hypothetical protein